MGNNCCTNRDRVPMTGQDIEYLSAEKLKYQQTDIQKSVNYIQSYFQESILFNKIKTLV
jgi:hypothetical protein